MNLKWFSFHLWYFLAWHFVSFVIFMVNESVSKQKGHIFFIGNCEAITSRCYLTGCAIHGEIIKTEWETFFGKFLAIRAKHSQSRNCRGGKVCRNNEGELEYMYLSTSSQQTSALSICSHSCQVFTKRTEQIKYL